MIVAVVSLLMVSCSSSSSPDAVSDKMTATITGAVSQDFTAVFLECHSENREDGVYISIDGTMVSKDSSLKIYFGLLNIPNDSSIIDFAVNKTSTVSIVMQSPKTGITTYFAESGTINFVTNNETEISGTFNLTFKGQHDNAVTMNNGIFFLKKDD